MAKRLTCPPGQNNLIHTLPRDDRALLEPHLKQVILERGFVLEEPDQAIALVYFPTSGVGSTVAFTDTGRLIEVGLFGNEGMSGTPVTLQASHSPHQSFMQVAGEGFAIDASTLRTLLDQNPTLQRHLLRYVQVMITQTSQTALSNGQSKLEERLARWLLMCHDRTRGDIMELTHEFLSVMLGVRRAGVTVAIHLLEGKGLIRANRGQIIILDRHELEDLAQSAYGTSEAEYARLIGFSPAENVEKTEQR
ncbi:Crp/Fnr family transcriptional regulator [Loktanella sp. M215]|uniref:Crp/Fnr family transcriptional regulator n=1 Tax=Loktanella sp. M215 TaxID=2675431 RepID=UPI001F2F316C|nr:Crp/Fnr family transcriptional regulator [Loktanella sp. M215]MCF7701907.1 helix-turn-helix domain-containing protein [Loktanella sp. M215]